MEFRIFLGCQEGYTDAARKFLTDNKQIGEGAFKDGVEFAINLSYEELGDRKASDIGYGNNLLDFSDLDKPEKQKFSSQASGTSDERNAAGGMAAMRVDAKSDPARAEARQQLNQNSSQFILINRADITGPAGNKKLLNN